MNLSENTSYPSSAKILVMRIILSFLLLLFLAPVVWAQDPSPFIAVYCSDDLKGNYEDNKHHFDLFTRAKDWSNFDQFLIKVRDRSLGRPIVLDLSIHGLDFCPVLVVGTKKTSFTATEGAVINHIEKYLGGKSLVVIQEACYGGYVYQNSLNPSPYMVVPCIPGCMMELRGKGHPSFPVLGFPNYRNVPPCGLEQYLHKEITTLEDLRYPRAGTIRLIPREVEELYVMMQRAVLYQLLKKDGVF